MLLSPRSAFEAKQRKDGKTAHTAKHDPGRRRKIAIVGSGCSGLGAAWALRDSNCEVHIFEKSPRLGGHTNTQIWQHGKRSTPVDTGFIVMNTATYPNFMAFLKEVGIEPKATEMTFGVSRDGGRFEWSGEPQGIFAQRRNIFRPRHWRMIYDIARFNQFALDLLDDGDDDENVLDRPGLSLKERERLRNLTIGEYLDQEGYSMSFRDDYLIPMTAAVWSTSPDKASLEFPAQTLIRFMWNHHLLSTFAARPLWLTIPGGSQRYIDAIMASYDKGWLHLHLSCAVTSVVRPPQSGEEPVNVSWINGQNGPIKSDDFDHVIFACHGDQILPMLSKQSHFPSKALVDRTNLSSPPKKSPVNGAMPKVNGIAAISDEEHEIFSAFTTTQNVCYLHSDLSLMPIRRKCWTSWNYLVTSHASHLSHPAGVSLTYCMNILQHLPEEKYGPVLVTMNPPHRPDQNLIQGEYIYEHPLYTRECVRAQRRLKKIQNQRGVSYCGAWTNYGFHEDGFSSGLSVAVEHLGAQLPFTFVDSTYSRGHRPKMVWKDYVWRVFLLFVLFCMNTGQKLMNLPVVAQFVVVYSHLVSLALDYVEHTGLLDVF